MQDPKTDSPEALKSLDTLGPVVNENTTAPAAVAAALVPPSTMPTPAAGAAAQPLDPLDELADLDFLLEDIEDKIAPLALSMAHDF